MTKMADLFIGIRRWGKGRETPVLERLRIAVGGEESRAQPQVLTEERRGQHLLW